MNQTENKNLKLPTPTGVFQVGVRDFILQGKNKEKYSEINERRKIAVHLFYPSRKSGNIHFDYFDGLSVPYSQELAVNMGVSSSVILKKIEIVKTNTFIDVTPEVLANPKIIIFSHGFFNSPWIYTSLFEELASHGYYIFALAHPYGAAVTNIDGKVIKCARDLIPILRPNAFNFYEKEVFYWLEDFKCTIDHIRDGFFSNYLMNSKQIYTMGHSFGGCVASYAAQLESVKAGIDLDGPIFGSPEIDKPHLFLLGDISKTSPPPTTDLLERIGMSRDDFAYLMTFLGSSAKDCFNKCTSPHKYFERIAGADHMSFSDHNFIFSSDLSEQHRAKEILGAIKSKIISFLSRDL
jgi:pimeloyl-ACP methyl ester carboxylesterase